MHVWIDEWERLESTLGSHIKWKDPTYFSFASRIAHFTLIHVLVLPTYTVRASALLPRDSLTMFLDPQRRTGVLPDQGDCIALKRLSLTASSMIETTQDAIHSDEAMTAS